MKFPHRTRSAAVGKSFPGRSRDTSVGKAAPKNGPAPGKVKVGGTGPKRIK